jgi:alpha-beta hydrolase superfamily lysophospholipase
MKFSLTEKIKIYLGMVLYPRKQFKMPFDSQMCTRDPDCQKAMDADKREHRLATPRLLFNILLAQSRVNSLKEKIKIPVLFLIAGDSDKLTDPGESKAVFNGLKTKDKEIIQYTDMFHSLTIELGREKVFGDILTWVNKRI